MQSKKKLSLRVSIVTIASVIMAIILILSGVGIYLTITKKDKHPVEINPLDFSVDSWDGSVSGTAFNEAYAGRSVKTKTINSASAFAHFINEVNGGNSFAGYTVYLNSNINLKNKSIDSIKNFKGTFDGGHYTIMNAKVKGKALFENVENATIKNVGLYDSNASLINIAKNSNIENVYVRLGSGKLVEEFISNNGTHTIKNSFVDSSAKGLIGKLDTNGSQENEVTISNCYFTQGDKAINEIAAGSFVVEENLIKATNKADFADWSYASEYSSTTEWCDYDYLVGSQKLDFVYPLQAGFVKVFLTGSCYESVMVAGDTVVDATNFAVAFEEADKNEDAQINLLVEKIFMEAKAELSNANVTISATKDTEIVRGENNTESMFISKGGSKISIGTNSMSVGVASASSRASAPTITIDGNRENIEKNELESNALVVSYGGQVEIGKNVVIKNNINNSEVGYGGAVLLYNTRDVSNIEATFENCHSEKSGGAVAIIGSQAESVGLSFKNCSSDGNGGAIYIASEIEDEASLQSIHTLYGNGSTIRPMADRIETTGDYEIKEDLEFVSCASQFGGAINVSGKLKISANPTFTNGYGEYGGAIYAGIVEIIGTPTFTNNGCDVSGGAIHASSVEISNVATFTENYTNAYYGTAGGGAIYTSGDVKISAAAIFTENNGASGNGGAIYASAVTISGDAIFEGNVAYGTETNNNLAPGESYKGGAIYSTGDILLSGASRFISNVSTEGGAIYTNGSVTFSEISECSFIGNEVKYSTTDNNAGEANPYAGAIYSKGSVSLGGINLFKENKVLEGAPGGGSYGAIYSAGDVVISGDSVFDANEAIDVANALYVDNADLTITGNPIFKNHPSNSAGGEVVAVIGGNLTISGNPEFVGNVVSIFVSQTVTSEVINEETLEESHEFFGGNVEISGAPIFRNNTNSSLIVSNFGCGCGQADGVSGCEIEISGAAQFVGNGGQSVIQAGQGYENGTVDVIISGDAIFEGNTTGSYDGTIYAKGDVEIAGNAEFKNNEACDNGGAIYAEGDVIISGNATFEGNSAEFKGGVIYSAGDVEISGNTIFNENSVDTGEGVIYASGNVTISGKTTFSNGYAGSYAAGIYCEGNTTISGDITFTALEGEAVYTKGDVLITGKATFTEGMYGPVIYCEGNVTITGNSTFEGNTGYNGAITAIGDVIISGDAAFKDNVSEGEGGAIYAEGTVLLSGDVEFVDNEATNGGAIYAQNVVALNETMTYFDSGEYIDTELTVDWSQELSIETTFMYDGSDCTIFKGETLYITIESKHFVYNYLDMGFIPTVAYTSNETIPSGVPLKLMFTRTNVYNEGDVVPAYVIDAHITDVITDGEIFSFTWNHYAYVYPDSTSLKLGDNIWLGEFKFTNSRDTQIFNPQQKTSGKLTFKNNEATSEQGGAIYASNMVSILADADFINNTATSAGGAIYAPAGVSISGNVVFSNNISGGEGGAIFSGSDVVITKDARFVNNYTSGNGGAIYATNVKVLGDESIFQNNVADYAGGAICASSKVEIAGHSVFKGNVNCNVDDTEKYGGAIKAGTEVKLLGETEFIDNRSDCSGGAIAATSVKILGESIFSGNSSMYGGGAIQCSNIEIFAKTIFEDNSVECNWGSAINVTVGSLDILAEVTLKNNTTVDENAAGVGLADIVSQGSNIVLGANINWATNDNSRYAIYIPQNNWIEVAAQLTDRIPVYKEGVQSFSDSNVQSYIFEDKTPNGLTGVLPDYPFWVNYESYYAMEYGVVFNALKENFGVYSNDYSKQPYLYPGDTWVSTNQLTISHGGTGSFNFENSYYSGAEKFNFYVDNESVVQIESVTPMNVPECIPGEVLLKSISAGTAKVYVESVDPQGNVIYRDLVQVTVEPRENGVEIGAMPTGMKYSEMTTISYKAQTAGKFEIISLNSVVEVVSYSRYVVAGHNYSAFIKATNVGDAEIMIRFTPDSEYYQSFEGIETFTVETNKLATPTNLRLTARADGARTILRWDPVSMDGVNVTYRIYIENDAVTIQGSEYVDTKNSSFDVYNFAVASLEEHDIGKFSVVAMSGNTDVCENSDQATTEDTLRKDIFYLTSVEGANTFEINGVLNTFDVGMEQTMVLMSGQQLEIKVIVSDEFVANGYVFNKWTGANYLVIDNVNSAKIIVQLPNIAYSFDILSPSIKKRTFNVQAISSDVDFGTVTKSSVDCGYGETVVIEGNKITIGDTTIFAQAKEATAEFSYEFAGWVGVTDGMTLNKDLIVYAMFTRTINQYTIQVTHRDVSWAYQLFTLNGVVLEEDSLDITAPYGTAVEFEGNILRIGANEIVVKASIQEYMVDYRDVFKYWEGMIAVVDGHATITAYFEREYSPWKVTIVSQNPAYGLISLNGELAGTQTVETGSGSILFDAETGVAELDDGKTLYAVPAEETEQYRYVFAGWVNEHGNALWDVSDYGSTWSAMLGVDSTFYAAFERIEKSYDITIVANAHGSVSVELIEDVLYGTSIKTLENILMINGVNVVANPADKTPTHKYVFSGWVTSAGEALPETVTGDITIVANFTETIRTYSVVIRSCDDSLGTINGQASISIPVEYGISIFVKDNTITINGTTYTAQAVYQGSFIEWQGIVGVVNTNVEITAIFSKIKNVKVEIWDEDSSYTSNVELEVDEHGTKYFYCAVGDMIYVEGNKIICDEIELVYNVPDDKRLEVCPHWPGISDTLGTSFEVTEEWIENQGDVSAICGYVRELRDCTVNLTFTYGDLGMSYKSEVITVKEGSKISFDDNNMYIGNQSFYVALVYSVASIRINGEICDNIDEFTITENVSITAGFSIELG